MARVACFSYVTYLPAVGSDHCHLLVFLEDRSANVKRHFKFEAFWAQDPECREVINRRWNHITGRGMMLGWNQKQKRCNRELCHWSKNKFPNSKKRVESFLSELEALQDDWDQNHEQIDLVKDELKAVWSWDELFWKQRSRIQWLKGGDLNTAFFHHSIIQCRRRNRVLRIKNINGVWVEDENHI